MKLVKGFFINLQFFTVIPIRRELPMDAPHLKKAVQAFPLLGLFQGFIYASLLFLLEDFTPLSNLAIAFLLWLATILITGGIHLDGWMDASDAYFSYKDPQKRLEIMKDPRTGAFGVLSVIVLLSCRFFFLYEIILYAHPDSFDLIVMIPFLSKSVMGSLLLSVKSAKQEGLGALFQGAAARKDLWIYPIYVLSFVAFVVFSGVNILLVSILIIMALIVLMVIRRKVVNWFGGITGDVLGATVEGTELILWMTVWLLHYFVMA